MIKNYKTCREKAQDLGKIFILKNNQPDAVLFSMTEYGKIAAFVEYLDNHTAEETEKRFMAQATGGNTKEDSLDGQHVKRQ